jgi:prepilin-type N-terminal cleavage/methylation domain-containing protein
MTDNRVLPVRASQSGFTLAELLLASVLGAMLLSSLAVTTFGFAHTLDYMEDEAGVNDDADPVLRRITKEVREAWWVEHPEADVLEIADANGAMTTYSVQGDGLWVERPNGDTGEIYGDFLDFTIESQTMLRKREGEPVNMDGIFYAASGSGSPVALVVEAPAAVALAFVAPAVPSDVPGQPADEEQVLSVEASVFDLAITFKELGGAAKVSFELYEGWAPGKAQPTGSMLAGVQVNGSSLPMAVPSGGSYQVPSSESAISLSEPLQPGVGYTLVVRPMGSNLVVLKVLPSVPSFDVDEVAMLSGSSWAQQALLVPFDVKGPWTKTSTETFDVVSMVTLTAYPTHKPLQQRSAAVLSQAVTEDPWLGVVPGELAP